MLLCWILTCKQKLFYIEGRNRKTEIRNDFKLQPFVFSTSNFFLFLVYFTLFTSMWFDCAQTFRLRSTGYNEKTGQDNPKMKKNIKYAYTSKALWYIDKIWKWNLNNVNENYSDFGSWEQFPKSLQRIKREGDASNRWNKQKHSG